MTVTQPPPDVTDPSDGPAPEPSPGRSNRVIAAAVIGAAAMLATPVVAWMLASDDEPQPPVAIRIDQPARGTQVERPQVFTGALGEALEPGQSVWGSTRSLDGTYYPQDAPCTVDTDNSFSCAPLYVGADDSTGESWRVCVFIVDDPTALHNYASRPDPRNQNPGLPDEPAGVVDRECVTIST